MIKNLDIMCSEQYRKKIEKIFDNVTVLEKEKTIVINNEFECEFNPDLYLEQRILRCLQKNDFNISDDIKIILSKSLINKTKRFLLDTDKELMADFEYLIDTNREKLSLEIQSLFEVSYNDVLFESEIMSTVSQNENIATINVYQDILNKYEKTISNVIEYIKDLGLIEGINSWIINYYINDKCSKVYIISNDDLSDFSCPNITRQYDNCTIELSLKNNKCKKTKCMKELREFINFV